MLNMWLVPFFNTTIQEAEKNWVGEKNSRKFYNKYRVTNEQHDIWYSWVIYALSKERRWSVKFTKKQFLFTYLNCAPSVFKEPKTP